MTADGKEARSDAPADAGVKPWARLSEVFHPFHLDVDNENAFAHALEAIDYFVYRIVREIGSLVAALGGLDALIFTAGVGENSPVIRQRVCVLLGWLGIGLDPTANDRGTGCISVKGAAPSVWVVPTDEEYVIAAHTLTVLQSLVHR